MEFQFGLHFMMYTWVLFLLCTAGTKYHYAMKLVTQKGAQSVFTIVFASVWNK